MTSPDVVTTDVPARIDRLPWSRWHWRVLVGLGTVWVLDGLEVNLVGSIASRLEDKDSGLALTAGQVGQAASVYVVGACVGALFFGRLTDRLGRKRLFMWTLGVYLTATVATAFSPDVWFFYAARFVTGSGIGGEYAAINSAIDELIPARVRGRVDLVVNGSYWAGGAAAGALSLLLLDKNVLAANVGWRVSFGLGAVLGLGILVVRRKLPESPRWLITHGRAEEAERLVREIEGEVRAEVGEIPDVGPDASMRMRQRDDLGLVALSLSLVRGYPRRVVLGLSLFVGQAFLYNAVSFTQATILSTFFGVSSGTVGLYVVAFAVGNFLGPVLLGPLFDVVGRRVMITVSYVGSSVLLALTAWWFASGGLSAWGLTACQGVVFFLASAGASAAYLTVSEIFPLEARALAISVFYAVGTGLGGVIGPLLFGKLVDTGHRGDVAWGYLLGAGLMAAAGIVELVLGVDAERKSLEDVARPLSAADDEPGGDGVPGASVGVGAVSRGMG